MNLKILLFALSAATITSCSTTYKSGQTPDDVYYSPAKPVEERHEQEQKEEPATMRYGYMDRQIVMSIYDPRWRYFDDDYDAYYDPYRYGYSCGYYYNPYYYPFPVYISGSVFTDPKNTVPRMTNLGSYNYSNMVVVNQKTGSTTLIRSTRAYNNSNDNFIRRIISPSNYNSSNSSSYRPSDNSTRTYSPSSGSSSNSSSGSSSSGAPVSRPSRVH